VLSLWYLLIEADIVHLPVFSMMYPPAEIPILKIAKPKTHIGHTSFSEIMLPSSHGSGITIEIRGCGEMADAAVFLSAF
jgi:hypothetical protein